MPIPAASSLFEPEALQTWLTALPWMDSSRVARDVRDQLRRLADQPLVPRQRDRLLRCYQPHVLNLTAALEDTLLDSPLPLPPETAETARLLVELCDLMARNHHLLADTWTRDAASAEEILTVVHRALDWLARRALHQAQIYLPPDTAFWNTVYSLYRRIDQHALLLHPDAGPIREPLHTLLLFPLCAPQRFRPRELRQIDRLLRHFGQHARLFHAPRQDGQRAGFVFDDLQPEPPRPLRRLRDSQTPKPNRHYLFTQPVIRQLLDYVQGQGPAGVETLPFDQTRRLALQLAHALGAPKQRRWLRRQEHQDCRTVVGLETLVAFLRHRSGSNLDGLMDLIPAAPAEPAPSFSLAFHPEPSDRPDDDGERYGSEADTLRRLHDDKAQIRPEDIWTDVPRAEAERVTEFAVELVDVSARGYRLRWRGTACPRLRPGELLGILRQDGEPEIAAIRWLHQNSDRQLTLGVELLSFKAQLVVVSRFVPDLAEDGLERKAAWGLVLPAQPAIERGTCLLVAARAWRRGQWVDIHYTRDRKVTFHLRQRLDGSPAYDLFTIEGVKLDAAADTRQ